PVADSFQPFAHKVLGLALATFGLVCAVVLYGGFLFVAMLIIGLGLGTMQSASLALAFASVSSPRRASVAWNMNFDGGLAVARVLGGIGLPLLGSAWALLVCAIVLMV